MNLRVLKEKIGVIIMTTGLSAMLAACGPVVRSEQQREEMTIKYLEEKYSEEFVIVEAYSQKIGEDWFSAKAYAKSHPEFLFNATITADGSRGTDEYISRIICNKIAARISSNMNEMPGLFDVYAFRFGSMDRGCKDTGISIEDYVKRSESNQKYSIEVYYVPDKTADASRIYDCLVKAMDDLDMIAGNLYFYVTSEDKVKEIQGWMYEKGEDGNTLTSIRVGMFELKIPYEQGRLDMTKNEFLKVMKEKL